MKTQLVIYILIFSVNLFAQSENNEVTASKESTSLPGVEKQEKDKALDKTEAKKLSPKEDATNTEIESSSNWQTIKSKFKTYVDTVGYYLYRISQGPRANKPMVLPKEFKSTDYVVRKYLGTGGLLYVQVLNNSPMPKKGDVLFTYILEDRAACELRVASVIDRWALVENKSCQRFFLVRPGDYLVLKTNNNVDKWKAIYSNDYLALWLQYGKTSLSAGNKKFDGENLRYGLRAALDLSSISRAQINYGVGKNNLSSASSDNKDSFQGISYSSFHVLGRWSESWQWDLNNIQVMPMLGIGTVFENLRAHPEFSASGGGPTFGLLIKADKYKSVIDATINYCIIECKISEVGNSDLAIYKSPILWEARISAKSNILPWPGLGLLTYLEYYSISSGKAYITNDTAVSRPYKEQYFGLGLGITYSWN